MFTKTLFFICFKFSTKLHQFINFSHSLFFLHLVGGSAEKSPSKDMGKKNFPTLNLSQSVFVLENPTHRGLETAVCPSFAKPVLDTFAVCILVLRINLSHTQQSYLCQKKSKLLTREG